MNWRRGIQKTHSRAWTKECVRVLFYYVALPAFKPHLRVDTTIQRAESMKTV